MHATIERSQSRAIKSTPDEIHTFNEDPTGTSTLDDAEDRDKDLDHAISTQPTQPRVDQEFLNDILAMVERYKLRERRQRRYGLTHFVGAALTSIGSFVAIWWSPRNYVAFILILLSTFGIMGGTLNGLIGGLFVGWELRALAEFEWEVRTALHLAGGPALDDRALKLKDWYD